MPTTTEPTCPKCGNQMWNNIGTKTNPKAPDYKCKDRACDGAIWPPKNGAPRAAAPAQVKQPYNAGPRIPAIDDTETGGPPSQLAHLDRLFALYGVCLAEAVQQYENKLAKADFGAAPDVIPTMAATLFIQAAKL